MTHVPGLAHPKLDGLSGLLLSSPLPLPTPPLCLNVFMSLHIQSWINGPHIPPVIRIRKLKDTPEFSLPLNLLLDHLPAFQLLLFSGPLLLPLLILP